MAVRFSGDGEHRDEESYSSYSVFCFLSLLKTHGGSISRGGGRNARAIGFYAEQSKLKRRKTLHVKLQLKIEIESENENMDRCGCGNMLVSIQWRKGRHIEYWRQETGDRAE